MKTNDLGGLTVFTQSIAPADRTASVTGSEVDCSLCPVVATIRVNVGTVTLADSSNLFKFTVTQCATSGGSFTDADSSQYDPVSPTGSTTAWDRIINATTEGSKAYTFNFRMAADYPYIKVVATETGTAQAAFGACVEFEPSVGPGAVH